MKVVALTGGVGGAKLVLGLARVLPNVDITAIVNTGDDFCHLGLSISPDIDTLLYTLAGKANREQGWGREDESWNFMAALRELGGEDWFLLGDRDLALHVLRGSRLASGQPLSAVTADLAKSWGIEATVLPMSDDAIATQLETDEGTLAFQHYFVRRRCEPIVRDIRFRGATASTMAPGVAEAIATADRILIAPSNPYLSVDPILAVPGLREALTVASAPVVAVSPIIGAAAVKGPTAKLMSELGRTVSNETIAEHYRGLIDGLLIDARDSCLAPDIIVGRADTMMHTDEDKARVARAALALAAEICASCDGPRSSR